MPEQPKNELNNATLNTRIPRLFPMHMREYLLRSRFRRASAGVHAPVIEQILAGSGSLEQRLNARQ
jgi:hypothetical protein